MTTETKEVRITSEEDAAALVVQTLSTIPKTIKTTEQYEASAGLLAEGKLKLKRIEEFFEGLKKPIRLSLKNIQDTEKKIKDPLEIQLSLLINARQEYFLKAERERQERQARENEKHEQKVQAAIEKGKDPALVAPPKTVESKAPTTVQTTGGATVSTRMLKTWKLACNPQITARFLRKSKADFKRTNPGAQDIPNEYWILDTVAITKDIAAGKDIPGVIMYEVPSDTVRG